MVENNINKESKPHRGEREFEFYKNKNALNQHFTASFCFFRKFNTNTSNYI
jgi:hypothetical protein